MTEPEWSDDQARCLAAVMGDSLELQLENARYLQSRGYPDQQEPIRRLEHAIRVRDEDRYFASLDELDDIMFGQERHR